MIRGNHQPETATVATETRPELWLTPGRCSSRFPEAFPSRKRAVPPNPSLELTHSGRPPKPAVRQMEHRHTSGLGALPPRSAQLER
jgi:hypothetical protein